MLQQDVAIRFLSNALIIGPKYSLSNCSRHPLTSLVAEGISIPLPEWPKSQKINLSMMSAVSMKILSEKKDAQLHALRLYEINQAILAITTNA